MYHCLPPPPIPLLDLLHCPSSTEDSCIRVPKLNDWLIDWDNSELGRNQTFAITLDATSLTHGAGFHRRGRQGIALAGCFGEAGLVVGGASDHVSTERMCNMLVRMAEQLHRALLNGGMASYC